jgi:hypothetical protein
MKNGRCPECNSTDVYFASSTESQGLREQQTIYLRITGLNDISLDTYVCANCGYIRSFVSARDLAQVATGIGKSKAWRKVV